MLDQLIGTNVLVRTVTFFYTGKLVSTEGGFAHLEDAAWIADTGRFADALKTGDLNEVEPYPGDCYVSLDAVADISSWGHKLPRTQK